MFRELFLVVFLFFALNLSAKSNDFKLQDDLAVIEIIDAELHELVDSLIENEKNMEYYDLNLQFYIDINHRKGITLLSVGSSHTLLKSGKEIGCVKFGEHNVIVSSNIDSSFFKDTGVKTEHQYYQPIEQKVDSSGIVMLDIFEDDSYTQWYYRVINGEFIKLP